MLLGEHDYALLIEVSDDATGARLILNTGMRRKISTTTMKASTEDEFRGITGSL